MNHVSGLRIKTALEINSRSMLGSRSRSASLCAVLLNFLSLVTESQGTGTHMCPESSGVQRSAPSFASNLAPALKETEVVEWEKKSVSPAAQFCPL